MFTTTPQARLLLQDFLVLVLSGDEKKKNPTFVLVDTLEIKMKYYSTEVDVLCHDSGSL